MTRPISVALKAHYALGTTTIATCWKAVLTNGTEHYATAHDQDIVFDGDTYLSLASYVPSDIVSTGDLSVDNLEIEGFLASPSITHEDVLAGTWDYADIEMFEVNYRDLTMGRNLIRKGTLGEVRAGRSKFNAELRGLLQKLSKRIIKLTSAECQRDLGDAVCGVDLGAITETGTVDTVVSWRRFTDPARTEATNWFVGGLLTWTSGLNDGLSMEVRLSTAAGIIELHESMPFEVQVGDTYSVYAGCTKRFAEDCIAKHSNGVNYGGFPHLPLSDVYKGPTK